MNEAAEEQLVRSAGVGFGSMNSEGHPDPNPEDHTHAYICDSNSKSSCLNGCLPINCLACYLLCIEGWICEAFLTIVFLKCQMFCSIFLTVSILDINL